MNKTITELLTKQNKDIMEYAQCQLDNVHIENIYNMLVTPEFLIASIKISELINKQFDLPSDYNTLVNDNFDQLI